MSTDERTGPTLEPEVWKATGLEPQVFLDRSGRRARRVSVAGVVAVVLGSSWLGGIVGASAGFASLPALHPVLVAHAAPPHVSHHHSRHGRHPVEIADIAPHRG